MHFLIRVHLLALDNCWSTGSCLTTHLTALISLRATTTSLPSWWTCLDHSGSTIMTSSWKVSKWLTGGYFLNSPRTKNTNIEMKWGKILEILLLPLSLFLMPFSLIIFRNSLIVPFLLGISCLSGQFLSLWNKWLSLRTVSATFCTLNNLCKINFQSADSLIIS
jgi:hypothetical protein